MNCKVGRYYFRLRRSYPESAWLLGVHYQRYFNAGANTLNIGVVWLTLNIVWERS